MKYDMWALTKLSGKLPLKNLYHREKHEWWVDRVGQGRADQENGNNQIGL